MLIDEETYRELLMCLNGADYCMSHDAADDTIAFELRKIQEMTVKLKELHASEEKV